MWCDYPEIVFIFNLVADDPSWVKLQLYWKWNNSLINQINEHYNLTKFLMQKFQQFFMTNWCFLFCKDIKNPVFYYHQFQHITWVFRINWKKWLGPRVLWKRSRIILDWQDGFTFSIWLLELELWHCQQLFTMRVGFWAQSS